MKILYVGLSGKALNVDIYTLTLYVKKDYKFYQCEIEATASGILDPECFYTPEGLFGLNIVFVKKLIFQHKYVLNRDLQCKSEVPRAIYLSCEDIKSIKGQIDVSQMDPIAVLPVIEGNLYQPSKNITIKERFGCLGGKAKLMLISVNNQTGEEYVLEAFQPYKE